MPPQPRNIYEKRYARSAEKPLARAPVRAVRSWRKSQDLGYPRSPRHRPPVRQPRTSVAALALELGHQPANALGGRHGASLVFVPRHRLRRRRRCIHRHGPVELRQVLAVEALQRQRGGRARREQGLFGLEDEGFERCALLSSGPGLCYCQVPLSLRRLELLNGRLLLQTHRNELFSRCCELRVHCRELFVRGGGELRGGLLLIVPPSGMPARGA
mmetsp:Transcript_45603/g.126016  ORF Transcript_45603/g.126016 Transcript_45603/m.126016 type:complete len:215 (+) Transcript_45603:1660-2304(+)